MTVHWYLSIYDRKADQLMFEGLISNVTDDMVRE